MIEKIEEFLRKYYEEELFTAVREGKNFIVVDYNELDKFDYELAEALLNNPKDFFENAKVAVENIDLPSETRETINVRIKELPEDEKVRIKDLRSKHLGKFIKIEGTVRRASEVMPELEVAIFECPDCGEKIEIPQTRKKMTYPSTCPSCGRKRGFKQVDRTLSDSRWIAIEDLFEEVSGEKPGEVNVYLKNDLTVPRMQRKTDPGARLEVSGIVREIPKRVRGKKTKKLNIFIEANHVQAKEVEFEELQISDEDEEKIHELASDDNIYQRLIDSLAPSMHGMREIKESIALQLFGGVPHELPDGTKIRGDIHVLLVGDPGTGKCVSGDTDVTLANGDVRNIKDIVEETHSKNETFEYDGEYCFSNHDLMTLDSDGKISKNKGVVFWKRNAPEHLYKITTASGREVKVTPEHPFFIFKGGQVKGEEARNISEGTMIATPREIPAEGEPQELGIDIERSKTNAAKHIDIPEKTSPELCRFIGYLLGEGYSRVRPTSCHVSITNSSEEVIEDFKGCLQEVFGNELNFSRRKTSEKEIAIYTSSIELDKFLEELEPSLLRKSNNKKIPSVIFRCSNEEISNLLRSYFDGDAAVNKDEKSICVTSASEDLIKGIRNLLFRLGIFSQLSTREGKASNSQMSKKKYYRLRISGENVDRYYDRVGFLIPEKSRKLEKLVDKDRKGRNMDFIPPLSDTLLSIRGDLKMTQNDFSIPRTTYQHYERGDRYLSRERLSELIEDFEERLDGIEDLKGKISSNWNDLKEIREELNISQGELAENISVEQTLISQYELGKCGSRKENKTTKKVKASLEGEIEEIIEDEKLKNNLNRFKLLANSDIYWDEISSIEKVKPEGDYVYDLQVNPTHNFIANNMFVHNTQIMKMVSDLIPRGRYVSGKGTSAAGLTASVVRDEEFMGGWVLEAGALVLSNKSLIAIDEFDKMSKEDQVNLHEAMSTQSYHPDFELQLSDGSSRKINEIVNELMDRHEEKIVDGRDCEMLEVPENEDIQLISTDFSSVYSKKPVRVSRHEAPDKFYKINTSSGRSVKVTPEHPMWTIRGGSVETKRADEIKEDDWIPVPMSMPIVGEEQDLENVKEFHPNSKEIELPAHNSPELCSLIGYMVSDCGYEMNRNKKNGINFTNSEEGLLKDFREKMEELFGLEAYERERKDKGSRRTTLRYVSSRLRDFFQELGDNLLVGGDKKQIPNKIMKCHRDELKHLLRSAFASDGGIVSKERGLEIVYTTSSEKLAKQISDLLLRFSITSKIRTLETESGKDIHRVVITGGRDIRRFKKRIGFFLEELDEKLDCYLSDEKSLGKNLFGTVPEVGNLVIDILDELNISQDELVEWALSEYKNNNLHPTRRTLERILPDIEKGYLDLENSTRCPPESGCDLRKARKKFGVEAGEITDELGISNSTLYYREDNSTLLEDYRKVLTEKLREKLFVGSKIEFLKHLVEGEIGWVQVDSVDTMESDCEMVFDVTIPGRTFISNGMVLHNTISISKASIQATLPARTSVIGGANPKLSRFDPYRPINEQIDIPQTILSRFDIRFTLRDVPDEEEDEKLVDHIIEGRVGEDSIKPEINPDLLKKYVAYARENSYPEMTEKAASILKNFYVNMRNKYTEDDSNSVPLSLRQYEALLRLSEASAKVKLKDEVSKEDAQRAIKLMKESLKQLGMDPETGNIDIDRAEGGTPGSQRSKIRVVMDLMDELEEEMGKNIPIEDLVAALEEEGLSNADKIIREMKQKGMIFEPRPGHIQKI